MEQRLPLHARARKLRDELIAAGAPEGQAISAAEILNDFKCHKSKQFWASDLMQRLVNGGHTDQQARVLVDMYYDALGPLRVWMDLPTQKPTTR